MPDIDIYFEFRYAFLDRPNARISLRDGDFDTVKIIISETFPSFDRIYGLSKITSRNQSRMALSLTAKAAKDEYTNYLFSQMLDHPVGI